MKFSTEPLDGTGFTAEFDRFYSRFARVYELAIRLFPVWRRWISQVLPYVQGPRVLEVSFGTGYLLTQYKRDLDLIGVEYNREMIRVAQNNALERGRLVSFPQADVNHLPFQSSSFDTIVNTMAFTAYPDGQKAMSELSRVLRPRGRLVMVDIDYPHDKNYLGVLLTKLWMRLGDIVRDMSPLFQDAGFDFTDTEIGGWGSVHLYVATKVN